MPHFFIKFSKARVTSLFSVITRKKQAEQSAKQPAEKIGCLQDQSAGSESRLMRGSDVTIPITSILNYSVILSECEESHKIEKVMRYFGNSHSH